MAKRNKWSRPAHHAPMIYVGVLNGKAKATSYPGLDFHAPMNEPVGYETEFLQHIARHSEHGELMAMIAKKGLEIGTDILTVADLKNKVCADIVSRNAVEEAFSAYMLAQLEDQD